MKNIHNSSKLPVGRVELLLVLPIHPLSLVLLVHSLLNHCKRRTELSFLKLSELRKSYHKTVTVLKNFTKLTNAMLCSEDKMLDLKASRKEHPRNKYTSL